MSLIAASIIAIGVNLGSVHSRDGLNNVNPGLYAVSASGYAGGIYHNSHRKPSVWAARKWEAQVAEAPGLKVSAAVLAGVVTGYGKPSPLVSPSLAFEHEGVTLRFSFAPKHPTKPSAAAAVHASIEVNL